jgi:hypothetical protein
MLASGFVLSTGHHFQVAIHNGLPVEVWQQGQIIDYGGPIDRITEDTVWINGCHYVIAVCEFKIR